MHDSITLEVLYQHFELGAFVDDATKRKCRSAVRKLIEHASNMQAEHVDVPTIGRWQVWMKQQKMSVASIRSYFGAVRQMYSWAVRQSLLTANPFDRAPNVRPVKRAVPTFTTEEIEDLADAAALLYRHDPSARLRWTGMIYIAADCALRIGEIWNLRWADMDLDDQLLWVRYRPDEYMESWQWGAKGKADRPLPISGRTLNCLHRLREVAPWPYPFLKRCTCERLLGEVGNIPEKQRKEPYNNFYRELNQIKAYANGKRAVMGKGPIKNGGFHRVRKTAVTAWAKELPMPYVQVLAGHQSMATTRDYYVHVDAQNAVKALRALQ